MARIDRLIKKARERTTGNPSHDILKRYGIDIEKSVLKQLPPNLDDLTVYRIIREAGSRRAGPVAVEELEQPRSVEQLLDGDFLELFDDERRFLEEWHERIDGMSDREVYALYTRAIQV